MHMQTPPQKISTRRLCVREETEVRPAMPMCMPFQCVASKMQRRASSAQMGKSFALQRDTSGCPEHTWKPDPLQHWLQPTGHTYPPQWQQPRAQVLKKYYDSKHGKIAHACVVRGHLCSRHTDLKGGWIRMPATADLLNKDLQTINRTTG